MEAAMSDFVLLTRFGSGRCAQVFETIDDMLQEAGRFYNADDVIRALELREDGTWRACTATVERAIAEAIREAEQINRHNRSFSGAL
jgi:Arc/MetJ-type ribon-helix-helix transcriptional regulator